MYGWMDGWVVFVVVEKGLGTMLLMKEKARVV